MKIKTILLAACLSLATAATLRAQTSNAPITLPATQTQTAQAAGQQVLDTIPVLNMLTNIPAATFDKAMLEAFTGLQNSGAEINNALALHYNIHTNFFVLGEATLGGGNVFNSLGLGGGVRYAWQNTEVYGGGAGVRSFEFESWQGEIFSGIAYKASSGMAVYGQLDTFVAKINKAPSLGFEAGLCFPF